MHLISLGLFTVFSTICTVKYSTYRSKLYPSPPLPDVIHQLCPPIWNRIPDLLAIFSTILTTHTCSVMGFDEFKWRQLTEQLFYCYLLRCITIFVTVIPTPIREHSCWGKHDLMFSGHTLFFQYLGIIAQEVAYHSLPSWQVFLIKWCFPFTLIVSRQHYTVDVVVSFGISMTFNT